MMEQIALAPPLPPKTRGRSTVGAPPEPSATVLTGGVQPAAAAQVFASYSFPEVHQRSLSQITTTTTTGGHVVKIRINPDPVASDVNHLLSHSVASDQDENECAPASLCKVSTTASPCIRISVNGNHNDRNNTSDRNQVSSIGNGGGRLCCDEDMIQRSTMAESFIKANSTAEHHHQTNPYFFYSSFPNGIVMSSGQVSPSDTLDSGTCSDLDSTPPPLPTKKKNAGSIGGGGALNGVSVTVIGSGAGGQHKRASSLTSSGAEVDSDDNESNLSCDSLNSGELNALMSSSRDAELNITLCKPPSPPLLPAGGALAFAKASASAFLPQGLLQDIRERSAKLTTGGQGCPPICEQLTVETSLLPVVVVPVAEETGSAVAKVVVHPLQPQRTNLLVDESTYEQRKLEEQQKATVNVIYDTDCYYDFHLNEHAEDDESAASAAPKACAQNDESFAGYRDLLGGDGSSTIRSAKGTVRGVKNRVRAGIATFLQINSTTKSYKEKDAGKVVVYSTTMGIVRNTYHQCVKVKQILRTLLVKFEERDVFMSGEYQSEIRDRMRCDHILVPQVFVDGQHIGDAETIERLNETGELRRMLKPYKSMDACTTCKACGGYRLLPCQVCNGSKKSVHRNHFTTEFVALKCMNCDEVGLVKCSTCSS